MPIRFVGGGPSVPDELRTCLDTNAVTRNASIEAGYAECVTSLDSFGEGRHHDLVLIGSANEHRVLISIEAKADESFDELISARLREA